MGYVIKGPHGKFGTNCYYRGVINGQTVYARSVDEALKFETMGAAMKEAKAMRQLMYRRVMTVEDAELEEMVGKITDPD